MHPRSHDPGSWLSAVVGLALAATVLAAGCDSSTPSGDRAPASDRAATLDARDGKSRRDGLPPREVRPDGSVADRVRADRPRADSPRGDAQRTPAGGTLVTYTDSTGIGKIAVQVTLPTSARYADGAPVIVEVNTFFTGENKGFAEGKETTAIQAIHVSYLWPGRQDQASGARSDGEYDYGGDQGIAALRDVIRFASGLQPNSDGFYLKDLVAIAPLADNVGLYAFSHPGIAATNVLARHGRDLPKLKFFVGRENPTVDTVSCMEIGYWGDQRQPVQNQYYSYPGSYSATAISLDYSKVSWRVGGVAYQSGVPVIGGPSGEFVTGQQVPKMWDKRYYSQGLTQALLDTGARTLANWPTDVATPDEARAAWPSRMTTQSYATLKQTAPNLKVLLLFADDDHVQVVADKPHVHQAWDGFRKTADLWVRLNPDREYGKWAKQSTGGGMPDNPARSEPADWALAKDWAYAAREIQGAATFMKLAALAEMADRVHEGNWNDNLDAVLVNAPPPQP
jgi:hypothetical protein